MEEPRPCHTSSVEKRNGERGCSGCVCSLGGCDPGHLFLSSFPTRLPAEVTQCFFPFLPTASFLRSLFTAPLLITA